MGGHRKRKGSKPRKKKTRSDESKILRIVKELKKSAKGEKNRRRRKRRHSTAATRPVGPGVTARSDLSFSPAPPAVVYEPYTRPLRVSPVPYFVPPVPYYHPPYSERRAVSELVRAIKEMPSPEPKPTKPATHEIGVGDASVGPTSVYVEQLPALRSKFTSPPSGSRPSIGVGPSLPRPALRIPSIGGGTTGLQPQPIRRPKNPEEKYASD